MKKIILGLASFAALTLTACNNEDSTAEVPSTTMNDVQSNSDINNLQASETVDPNAIPQQNIATPASAAGKNPYADLKGNNPEHGHPGHRCDINVGEPLNSPPRDMGQQAPTTQVQPTSQVQPSNTPQVTPQNATPAKTEPGFSGKPNPEHGQPGHRCDLKVGEILP